MTPSGENIAIELFTASTYSASSSPLNDFGVLSAISRGVCVCIHWSVLTIALARRRVVSACDRSHSCCAYRTDAGYASASTASLTPADVRKSARMRVPGVRLTRIVNAGSASMPASTLPCSTAAMAVAADPMAVMLTASGGTPCRCSKYVRSICEDEPAAVTPATRPFRSSILVTWLCGAVTSTRPGKRIMLTNATSDRPSAAIWIV